MHRTNIPLRLLVIKSSHVARCGLGEGGLKTQFSPGRSPCTQQHAPRDLKSNTGVVIPVKNSLLACRSYAHEIRLGLATDASTSAVQWIVLFISWDTSKK